MRIVFAAIGDELLRGESREGNGASLAEWLARRGLRISEFRVLPDSFEAIANLVTALAESPTLVICSGGLGPTDDDFTRAAVADAIGRPLTRDESSVAALQARFARLGRIMNPSNLRQADFPQGAEVWPNAHGTAPGFAIRHRALHLVCLPGVPREFAGLIDDHLAQLLDTMGIRSTPRTEYTFRLFGVPESEMQGTLSHLPHWSAATMRSLPSWPDIRLELAPHPAAQTGAFEALLGEVQSAFGPRIYGHDRRQRLPGETLSALHARGAKVAIAESCTGGLVAQQLTALPGASEVVQGGVVAYANAAKQQWLGVPRELLERHGAVSEEVALAMAEGVRATGLCDVAVATTGIAGPSGGTPDKPVGTLCVALVADGVTVHRRLCWPGLGRDRFQILAAWTALDWLRRWALGLPI
jgi:nicotinamide-nucleotide amidase